VPCRSFLLALVWLWMRRLFFLIVFAGRCLVMGGLVIVVLNLLSRWKSVCCFIGDDHRQGRGDVNAGLLRTWRRRAPVRGLCGTPCDLSAAVGRRSVPNLSVHCEPGRRTEYQIGLKPAGFMGSGFTGGRVFTSKKNIPRARRVTRIMAKGAAVSSDKKRLVFRGDLQRSPTSDLVWSVSFLRMAFSTCRGGFAIVEDRSRAGRSECF
jgi:hypothetical protein